MAVLPKKFDKHGNVGDYIGYMTERIEFYAQNNDKKVVEACNIFAELTERNKALEAKLIALQGEIEEIKQILINGGYYGDV